MIVFFKRVRRDCDKITKIIIFFKANKFCALKISQCHRLMLHYYYYYYYCKDYPSSTLIAELLNKQRIIPIFTVEKKVREVYDQLSEIIRSAFVGEITSNLDILLELIRNQYTVRK